MKSVTFLVLLAIGVTLTSCQTPKLTDAKLSKDQAQAIALTKAPGGKVKESELEVEHGTLVWSFDIARPGKVNITEVQVDAISGAVVSVEEETPEQNAKEAAEDKLKKQSKS